MSQFVYSILQYIAGFITIFLLLAIYNLLTEKFNFKKVTSTLFILIPYFIIGIITYNVKKERIGAVCCDEWNSSAKGSGACSSHGGVREWEIKYHYEEYDEPFNTVHKIFYFWYALNEDHMELDYVGCDDEDDFYEPKGIGTE